MNLIYPNYHFMPDSNELHITLWPLPYKRLFQRQIKMITHLPSNTIIYQPQITGLGGVLHRDGLGYRLVLDYDVTSMHHRDELQIIIDVPDLSIGQIMEDVEYLSTPHTQKVKSYHTDELLHRVLIELMKIETHLSMMTGEEFSEHEFNHARK